MVKFRSINAPCSISKSLTSNRGYFLKDVCHFTRCLLALIKNESTNALIHAINLAISNLAIESPTELKMEVINPTYGTIKAIMKNYQQRKMGGG